VWSPAATSTASRVASPSVGPPTSDTVSGDSIEEAIEAYGPALCSHCFKNAPSEYVQKSRVEKDADGNPLTVAEAQAARDARQAEKDAKAAAKNAKRVIDPETGTDVEDADQHPLKTEVAVRNEILRLLENIRYYGDGEAAIYRRNHTPDAPRRSDVIARLVKALAAKQGRDAAELLAEFRAKDAKKARRG
jgi:hypothetical protein